MGLLMKGFFLNFLGICTEKVKDKILSLCPGREQTKFVNENFVTREDLDIIL